MILWFPVLWQDEDFDYAFLLKIIKFKLSMLAHHIDSHAFIVDHKEIADEILETNRLIDAYTNFYPGTYPETEKGRWLWTDAYIKNEQKAFDAIWRHISKNARKWWD